MYRNYPFSGANQCGLPLRFASRRARNNVNRLNMLVNQPIHAIPRNDAHCIHREFVIKRPMEGDSIVDSRMNKRLWFNKAILTV